EPATPAVCTLSLHDALPIFWFTMNQANAIGRITGDGDVATFPLPTDAAGPVGICRGGDDAVWFAEILSGQIGRITVDGDVTEFPDRKSTRLNSSHVKSSYAV